MELKVENIRNVLLAIEKLSFVNDQGVFNYIHIQDLLNCSYLKHFNKNDLIYTLKKLIDANYIVGVLKFSRSGLISTSYITELTFEGHQFLDTIRNQKVFSMVMNKINDIGSSVTLDIIKATAIKILQQKLGL